MLRNEIYATTVFRLLENDYVTCTDGERDCIRLTSAIREDSQKRIKRCHFCRTGEISARKIHRYRSNRDAAAIRESIFEARLASFRYWYHSTNDNPDTVHRAIPTFLCGLDLCTTHSYPSGERDPPDARDPGLKIARSECDSRVQSLLIATLADRHGTLDKTGGSLDRWGRPLSFSLFVYLSCAHVGQGRTRHASQVKFIP